VGRRAIERRLRKVASDLRSKREELRVIDEQLPYLRDEADDQALRALVAEGPVGSEPREARAHAEVMVIHRARLASSIAALEARQDQLLDELGAG
jgi:hypothetical protein